MMFSHGNGGSRNTYSQLLGTLASYGVVTVAVDHRDGSSPLQHVRNHSPIKYVNVPFKQSEEVLKARDKQLRIRLWEICLAYEALLSIDRGDQIENLDPNSLNKHKGDYQDVLSMFKSKLHIQTPGSVIWAGHSFGGATMMQLLKSVYWRHIPKDEVSYDPLLRITENCNIVQQLTPSSLLVLLDTSALQIGSSDTQWLLKKPMPCYTVSGIGGHAILAIFSQEHYKMKEVFPRIIKLLAPPPDCNLVGPRMFFPTRSSHVAQSDFLLFLPWVLRVILFFEKPERIITLNYRAILQHLRENSIEVAKTYVSNGEFPILDNAVSSEVNLIGDEQIFSTNTSIEGWVCLNLNEFKDFKITNSLKLKQT